MYIHILWYFSKLLLLHADTIIFPSFVGAECTYCGWLNITTIWFQVNGANRLYVDFCSFCCSVVKLCPNVCNHTDCNKPVFPVLHHPTEFAQAQVHWVGDASQSYKALDRVKITLSFSAWWGRHRLWRESEGVSSQPVFSSMTLRESLEQP